MFFVALYDMYSSKYAKVHVHVDLHNSFVWPEPVLQHYHGTFAL